MTSPRRSPHTTTRSSPTDEPGMSRFSRSDQTDCARRRQVVSHAEFAVGLANIAYSKLQRFIERGDVARPLAEPCDIEFLPGDPPAV